MCYFCHKLGKNPNASSHHSVHCIDKANDHSKVPMYKRRYENGKRITYSKRFNESEPIGEAKFDATVCSICMEEKSNIAFVPCGHVSTCESCSSTLSICPICRQNISTKQKIFFP